MTPADTVKSAFHRLGLDIRRYRPAGPRRAALMAATGVRTVVDVGANTGQYGTALRRSGFVGDIVSFEPLDDAHRELVRTSCADDRWLCVKLAASDHAESGEIHVAGNSASSSLLVMAAAHLAAAPGSRVVGRQEVTLGRLDEVEALRSAVRPLMLKLDVQGHELAALEGAEGLLDDVVLVEAELSVVELYTGGPLILEMLAALAARGFDLVSLEPGFHDARDGRILQFDGFFRPAP